ncbi:MAG: hypothetical protein U0168_24945 [Nannocystaceae bacterium]
MVFAGVFPTDNADYPALRDALAKLSLNDASFSYEPETSMALGFGFRLGFLGLLHMEIVQERPEREYDLDLINDCAPSGESSRSTARTGTTTIIDNPAKFPDLGDYESIEEPADRGPHPAAAGVRRAHPRAVRAARHPEGPALPDAHARS